VRFDPDGDPVGALDALAGLAVPAVAPPSKPRAAVAADDQGSVPLPLHGGRFVFGTAASMALSLLGVRGDEREALRRAVESDARLERVLARRPPSPAALLRRAARPARRGGVW
jgi:hypothetical protein